MFHFRPRRYGKAPDKHFPNGTTAVIYEAKDRAGNVARCTVNATVRGTNQTLRTYQ